jgi:hypothetical protein
MSALSKKISVTYQCAFPPPSAAIKNHWNSTLRRQVALGQLPIVTSSPSFASGTDSAQSKTKKRRTDRDGRSSTGPVSCGKSHASQSPSSTRPSPPETPESAGTKAMQALDNLHIKSTPTPKRGKRLSLNTCDASDVDDGDESDRDEDQLSSHSTNVLGCELDECSMLLSPSRHGDHGEHGEDQLQPTRPARTCSSVFARRKPKGISIRTALDETGGQSNVDSSLWTPGCAPEMDLFNMSGDTPSTLSNSCTSGHMGMTAQPTSSHAGSPRSCLGVGEMFSVNMHSIVSRESGEMYALGHEPHNSMTAAEVASMLCTTPPQISASVQQCLC